MTSVKRNFIYNLIYQILLLILPIITTPYISRIMGSENIGIYSYAYSIAYYFGIFILLGLNNYGNKTIAKIQDNTKKLSKEFCSIYAMQCIIGIIVIILYILYIFAFSNNKIMSTILLFYLISCMFNINWFFWGIEKFKLTVTRNTIIKLLNVGLIFIFVKTSKDIYLYAIILSVCSFITEISLWPFLKKYIVFEKVKWKDIKKHIVPNITLFIPIIAVSLYTTMDKIMLGMISNMSELGYYENSNKLNAIPLAAINSLGTVMLPRTANMLANGDEENNLKNIKKSIFFAMWLSISMAFGLFAIIKEFVPIFYGNGYEKCKILIPILVFSSVFISWANVIRTQYLIPKDKNKIFIKSSFLGAIINIIINSLLIGEYGSVGAAIGTLLAESSVAIYQTICVRKDLDIFTYLKDTLYILLLGIMMYISIFRIYILNDYITLFIKVIVGVFVYLILSYIIFKSKLRKNRKDLN